MPTFKVAIIGAGPAGTMLARLLLKTPSVEVTIFEGEKTLDFRSQGGTLDLHTESGLMAMHRAGLYEEFLKHARFDGEALKICDKKLVKYINLSGGDEKSSRGRPEIDRPALRKMLVESLPAEIIRWGMRLRSIDDDLTLHFDSGVETGFDLIVGADGAWSKVRPLLTSIKPRYAGISGYQSNIPDAEHTAPEIYKLANRGSVFAVSDCKFLGIQQMGDGSINSSLWYKGEELQHKKTEHSDVSAAREDITRQTEGWDRLLVDGILKGDDATFQSRPLYELPADITWPHKHGLTIIGDAAHLMTPFAGEGVNLAFSDTVSLADSIIAAEKEASSGTSTPQAALDKHIAAFEKKMFERCHKVQEQTMTMKNAVYTQGFPRKGIESYVLGAVGNEVPKFTYPLAVVAVYAYFAFFKLFN